MSPTVVVTVDPLRVQAPPGEKASAIIRIRNRTEEVAHYVVRVDGISPEWAELAPDQVSAFPLQETRAQITVHPPPGTRSATYHLTIRAVSQEDASLEGQAQLDVDVPAPVQVAPAPATLSSEPPVVGPAPQAAEQIEVVAEPLKKSDLPPPAAQWRISLRNASSVLDTFSFNITGLSPHWVNLQPAALTLKPGEEGNAILTIRPGGDAPGRTYPFKLRTFSHLNLNRRTELLLEIDVRQVAGYKLAISPREAEAQGSREFQVSLSSDAASNSDLTVDLSASDQDNACDYTFQPNQVVLPARQTVTTMLRVSPKAVLGTNERKTYTIQVVATPRNGLGAAQSVQARLTQTGAAPLNLVLRPQVQRGDIQAEYALTAINPSTVQTTLVLSGQDPEEACDYSFQPSRLSLPPRGQAHVTLRVKARSGLDGETVREVPFTVSATRTGELVPAAQAVGKFIQERLQPVSLELVPPQQSQPGKTHYYVKAKNPRPSPVRIWLDAKDETDALAFSFQPSEIQLSGGAGGIAALMVQPKDKLPPTEQRRVHKFTVNGNVDGGKATITVNGVLAQTRGTDWMGLTGKGINRAIWAIKWIIAFVVVLFMGTLMVAATDRVATNSPELARLIYAVVSPAIIKGLLGASPFTGPAQRIVFLVEGIINLMTQPHR